LQMVYLSSIYTLHHNGSFRNAKTGFSEADGRVCAGPDKLENTRDYSKLWLVPGCVTPRRALHRRARCPSVPMAAAQTLVFASTVPGPGSASVPANVLGQEDPAMGSKTRISGTPPFSPRDQSAQLHGHHRAHPARHSGLVAKRRRAKSAHRRRVRRRVRAGVDKKQRIPLVAGAARAH
jgi:hypothetical protein